MSEIGVVGFPELVLPRIRTYAHTYIRTYPHTHIRTYAHTHIRTYAHTHIPTYTHAHIHTSSDVQTLEIYRHTNQQPMVNDCPMNSDNSSLIWLVLY